MTPSLTSPLNFPELGIPITTLGEYVKILELSFKMQEQLAKQTIASRDGLAIVRLELPPEKQDELAELAQEKGQGAFKAELKRLLEKKGRKRGAPPSLLVVRIVFSSDSDEEERSQFERLKRYCESRG